MMPDGGGAGSVYTDQSGSVLAGDSDSQSGVHVNKPGRIIAVIVRMEEEASQMRKQHNLVFY